MQERHSKLTYYCLPGIVSKPLVKTKFGRERGSSVRGFQRLQKYANVYPTHLVSRRGSKSAKMSGLPSVCGRHCIRVGSVFEHTISFSKVSPPDLRTLPIKSTFCQRSILGCHIFVSVRSKLLVDSIYIPGMCFCAWYL